MREAPAIVLTGHKRLPEYELVHIHEPGPREVCVRIWPAAFVIPIWLQCAMRAFIQYSSAMRARAWPARSAVRHGLRC